MLQSHLACCVWIPLFPLRCELVRRPDLWSKPTALLDPHNTKQIWQVSPLAHRQGVKPLATVSQAIALCPTLTLLEPDPVWYDERFAALLHQLYQVTPIVEPDAEPGRAYLGVEGLERLYGPPERVIAAIAKAIDQWAIEGATCTAKTATPAAAARLGWALGKFASWVAATRAKPGEFVILNQAEQHRFLAAQPIALLPLDPDTQSRLYRLGLRTLGDLAALPEAAVTSQFGTAGRLLWRLASGRLIEPVIGRKLPEPITAAMDFPSPVADRTLLARALERLIDRALKSPRRTGVRVHTVRARAELESGGSWMLEITLKDPSADCHRIAAPFKTRLEQAPPNGAVERLTIEFTSFAPGTVELQLFARDAQASARAGRRRALRAAAAEIKARLKRNALYRVVEVQPWSRIPERRYALIDYEP
jgi:nucleotidyltransferase/DNA polymerase involved in DNA repair